MPSHVSTRKLSAATPREAVTEPCRLDSSHPIVELMSPQRPNLAPAVLLVVDDDPHSRELEQIILEPAGYQVFRVSSGPTAATVKPAAQMTIALDGYAVAFLTLKP